MLPLNMIKDIGLKNYISINFENFKGLIIKQFNKDKKER